MAKAGVVESTNYFSEVYTDNNGFYDSITANELYFRDQSMHAYHVQQGPNIRFLGYNYGFPETAYQLNDKLRFIKLKTDKVISAASTFANYYGTIFYANGEIQEFSIAHSITGRNLTKISYIKPDFPNDRVTSVSIGATCGADNTTDIEATIWTNSNRSVDFQTDPGFFAAGYEYKMLPAYKFQEDGFSYAFGTVNDADEYLAITPEFRESHGWLPLPAASGGATKFRMIYNPPDRTSELELTKPLGVVLLRRAIE